MPIHHIQPKNALNQAYRRQKVTKEAIDHFSDQLKLLIQRVEHSESDGESEENFKNHLTKFLLDTYYAGRYEINTYQKTDLVIHNDKSAKSTVGILLEVKRPANKPDMVTLENLNAKAFQELLLYYFRQKDQHNNDLKYGVITNIHEWFIIDAQELFKYFYQDKALKKEYDAWKNGQKESKSTDYFYKHIAAPAIQAKQALLPYTYVNLQDYLSLIHKHDSKQSHKLTTLYKMFSPEHLLKQSFANDSNSLDKKFYHELLHIIGLTETKEKGKKLIQRRPEHERDAGSLLENTISVLDAENRLQRFREAANYGNNREEQTFNIALELTITWMNRILFLKLLEAQLINYHKSREYAFLNQQKIHDFDDLNSLFFKVMAKELKDRSSNLEQHFGKVPYLNSSLFEPTDLEYDTIFVSNLEDRLMLLAYKQTVLKDARGQSMKGAALGTLEYLFRFLDAYDFSTEGGEEIQEENKTLISASVLGLIFEKINGYKDGSFFTPGFITMYMCRETIRRAVLQKFNRQYGIHCETLDDLKNYVNRHFKTTEVLVFNALVNSLTLCDPAVGSGHFLVSALNEIIAIKSELGILADKEGKTVPVQVEVVNDELIVTDRNNEFFRYVPGQPEAQRIQQTLFHEKENLIESCLFGVDINENSVKICRLRLWIELLKNAYYTQESRYTELETLPNIDINIKTGNSLLYRFDLKEDLSEVFKKQQFSLTTYKDAVKAYKTTHSKEAKRELLQFIREIKEEFKTSISNRDPRREKLAKLRGQLLLLDNNIDLFGQPIKDPGLVVAEKKRLTLLIAQREKEIEDIQNNAIYRNAFEWRFEFPEVLDEKGNFIGFDIVIGNPPYIRQEELGDFKGYLQTRYKTFAGTADLYIFFVEQGMNLLRRNGHFTYILPNKWMRANYGKAFRRWLKQWQLRQIIDFGDLPVFEEATTYPCVLSIDKQALANTFRAAEVDTLTFEAGMEAYLQHRFNTVDAALLSDEGWSLADEKAQKLLEKIKAQGTPLGKYVQGKIFYGIKTGLNEAFVIDEATKDKLVAEDPKSAEVIKPFLAGRDIKRYKTPEEKSYLILFPRGWTKKRAGRIEEGKAWDWLQANYAAISEYLAKFKEKAEKRYDKGDFWWELRACDYYDEFEKPKIIYPNICKQPEFTYDGGSFYTNQKCFIITKIDMVLLAILNSKLTYFLFDHILPKLRGDFYEPSYLYFKDFPIARYDESNLNIDIKSKAEKILALKKQNPTADTSALEAEIDRLVYALYGLTEEEIKMIENSLYS